MLNLFLAGLVLLAVGYVAKALFFDPLTRLSGGPGNFLIGVSIVLFVSAFFAIAEDEAFAGGLIFGGLFILIWGLVVRCFVKGEQK